MLLDEVTKEQKFIDWTVLYRQDEIACYEMDVKACAGRCGGTGRKHLIQFFFSVPPSDSWRKGMFQGRRF
jgi:hypothetical protein